MPNSDRYSVNGEKYKVNDEKYKVNDEKYKVNDEKYKVNDEKYKVNDEKYKVNDEKYKVNDEKYKVNDEKYKVNDEKYKVNGEKYKVNDDEYSPKPQKNGERNMRCVPPAEHYIHFCQRRKSAHLPAGFKLAGRSIFTQNLRCGYRKLWYNRVQTFARERRPHTAIPRRIDPFEEHCAPHDALPTLHNRVSPPGFCEGGDHDDHSLAGCPWPERAAEG